MKDPYLRCDTCKQRVTAEMDDKRHCELIDALERSRTQLRNALSALRNETRGTLKAHELAIRYDSGNSNWQCLEMALEMADAALAPFEL